MVCILVVDDEEPIRDTLSEFLTEQGFAVQLAENAKEALPILADPDIAVLVSDIVMPGCMNGVGLAEAALALRPDLKVLLISGYTTDRLRLNGFKFLRKLFRMTAMLRIIGELLAAKEKAGELGSPA